MPHEDPIHEGFLQTDLEGRGFDLLGFGQITTGAGVPTASFHVSPAVATTTAPFGISWFNDLSIYRNAAGELQIDGAGVRSSNDIYVGSAKVLTEGLLADTNIIIDGGNI